MRIVKSLSVYTAVNFLQQGIAFPLAIIFSYYIVPEEMGLFSLFMLYISFFTILMQIGSESAITVAYYKLTETEYSSYFTSAFIIPFFFFATFQIFTLYFRAPIAAYLSLPIRWVSLIPIAALTGFLPKVVLSLYRIKEESIKFAIYNLAFTLVNLFSSLFFVIQFNLNWEGRALGILVSNIIFFGIGLIIIARSNLLTKRTSKHYMKDAFNYGLPLIPHLIGTFVIGYSDRVFIEKMVSLNELGIYDMGYKVGSLVMILVVSFASAYTPFLFESLKEPNERTDKKLALLAYSLFAVLSIALISLTVLSPFLFEYLINEKYIDGNKYVFYVGLACVFYGGYALFSSFLHFAKKTYIFAWLAVVNIMTNLILNYFFIKAFGAIGAAYATIISYAIVFIIVAYLTRNEHNIPYLEVRKNFKFLKTFLAEYRASRS